MTHPLQTLHDHTVKLLLIINTHGEQLMMQARIVNTLTDVSVEEDVLDDDECH